MSAAIRAAIFERDGSYCRVPWCGSSQFLEWAHLRAKSLGGEDSTANGIVCCRRCHQGSRSIHSHHITWEFLTDQGADGPMTWKFHEKLPKAELGLTDG